MPIAISGSGTITGISAGGLPDGCITTDDIANTAVTAQKLGTTEQGQLCKAWVNFNGTGTVAIRASYNVSSITDNGVGDYTVNFTTAMVDTNFCPVFGGQATSDLAAANGAFALGEEHTGYGSVTTRTTSTLRMWTKGGSVSARDNPGVFVAIFR